MYSQFVGVATNSTHVLHEVLVGAVSKLLVSYYILKEPEKIWKKFVSASNQNGLLGVLLQSEWFLLQWHSSWVVHLAEQFLFIVLEFQEYYKEKCTSHTVTPGEQFVFIVLEF